MAFFQMNYQSDALGMGVSVDIILPGEAQSGANYRTLYLLHGLSDDHTTWMRRTSIERYAGEHHLAVVMPNAGRSWYTNMATGAKYLNFVACELPDVCRGIFKGMSSRREDTFIAGNSMGGYGAFKAALTYPERFGGAASLSGTLDIADTTRNRPMNEWRGIFGFDMQSVGELKETEHDLFALARACRASDQPFPNMYFWCGEQERGHAYSERFDGLLNELGVAHCYESSPGDHSWNCWDAWIQNALRYLLGRA
jgi:S-formylglutathione hydrolase FrmB